MPVRVIATCEKCQARLDTTYDDVNRRLTAGWLIVWGWRLNKGGRQPDVAYCSRCRSTNQEEK